MLQQVLILPDHKKISFFERFFRVAKVIRLCKELSEISIILM